MLARQPHRFFKFFACLFFFRKGEASVFAGVLKRLARNLKFDFNCLDQLLGCFGLVGKHLEPVFRVLR